MGYLDELNSPVIHAEFEEAPPFPGVEYPFKVSGGNELRSFYQHCTKKLHYFVMRIVQSYVTHIRLTYGITPVTGGKFPKRIDENSFSKGEDSFVYKTLQPLASVFVDEHKDPSLFVGYVFERWQEKYPVRDSNAGAGVRYPSLHHLVRENDSNKALSGALSTFLTFPQYKPRSFAGNMSMFVGNRKQGDYLIDKYSKLLRVTPRVFMTDAAYEDYWILPYINPEFFIASSYFQKARAFHEQYMKSFEEYGTYFKTPEEFYRWLAKRYRELVKEGVGVSPVIRVDDNFGETKEETRRKEFYAHAHRQGYNVDDPDFEDSYRELTEDEILEMVIG